jgi:hypothetical protein
MGAILLSPRIPHFHISHPSSLNYLPHLGQKATLLPYYPRIRSCGLPIECVGQSSDISLPSPLRLLDVLCLVSSDAVKYDHGPPLASG